VNLRETIHRLLSPGHPESFLVLFDYLEEQGWPAEAWDHILEYLADSRTRIPYDPVWLGLLGQLARTNYPQAVDILNQINFPPRDYHSRIALVDAINTAHCAGRRGTWQERLEHEQMEQATRETNGDLEPWEGLQDPDGQPIRRQWSIDFAPEWLEHELQEEYGWDATFHTVYLDDGGNFGPSFDETLRDEQGLWRSVRRFDAGREAECPYRGGDEGGRRRPRADLLRGAPGREVPPLRGRAG